MNLYGLENPQPNSEVFSTLYRSDTITVEAIKSHLIEPGQIYNQEQDEWVVLITGEATLKINDETVNLKEGESLFLPKHTPHQVISTSKNALWLGVFSS